MRTLLRRELNEVSAEQWSDSELNDLLNYGLQWVQTQIVKVSPAFVVHRYLAPIQANKDLVDKPVGMLWEWRFEKLDSSSSTYKRVPRHPGGYEEMTKRGSGADLAYTHIGRWFAVHPVPTSDLADGWRVWFMPTLDMAADSDVPDIVHPLHYAVVLKAKLLAIGETAESSDDTRKRLGDMLADIFTWYQDSAAEPESFILSGLHSP
jgi:hypothetical protein